MIKFKFKPIYVFKINILHDITIVKSAEILSYPLGIMQENVISINQDASKYEFVEFQASNLELQRTHNLCNMHADRGDHRLKNSQIVFRLSPNVSIHQKLENENVHEPNTSLYDYRRK